jgi:glycosyltransferase involved in cell wall biosynthesis
MSHPPRLLVDVTRTVDSGLHTGIQRVVRGLLHGAADAAGPFGAEVLPVRCEGARWHALASLPPHALEYAPGHRREAPEKAALRPRPGDRLLLADASWYGDPWPATDALLAAGGRLHGFVHDLLPVRHPDWFRTGLATRFERHLRALCRRASGLFVATAHLAGELRRAGPPVTVLPPASSLTALPPSPLPVAVRVPYFLAVATLEPRKNHALLLDAFEARWHAGSREQLVLAGGAGWCNDALLTRVRQHPALGDRLLWLPGLDDRSLAALYRQARALLYLSRGEGFGLPLLEARSLGCPVIASDLPAHREAGGGGACYVPVDDGDALGEALDTPPPRDREGPAPRRWADCGAELLRHCLAEPSPGAILCAAT